MLAGLRVRVRCSRTSELTVRRRDGHADRRVLRSPEEMLGVLAEHFGLQFAAGTQFPCDALDWPA